MKQHPTTPKYLLIPVLLALAVTSRADNLIWDPGVSGGSGGTGTWNLTTANWYNGGTGADVKWTDLSASGTNTALFSGTAGTVTLNTSLSASNLQFTTPGYTLTGSGTLTLGGGGIDASSLGSGTTTIGVPLALPAQQQLWQVGSGGTLAIHSAVTRSRGATVDFSASGVTSTTLNNANGILGGWATVGGMDSLTGDWAANDGTGNIGTYTGYTVFSSTGSTTDAGAGAATQNWISGDPSGANNYITTLSANATINSLVMQGDFTLNSGVTLNLGSGGLMLRGVSRWLLGGSATTCFLTSGTTSGELFVHVPDLNSGNNWTLWPIIEDNGPTPLTLIKDGLGMLKLGNLSTYTGGTIVNAGTLSSTAGAEYGQGNAPVGIITPFGYGTVTVNNAQLQLGTNPGDAFGEYDYTNAITLNNSILYAQDGFHRLKGTLAIGSGGATLGATYDNKGDALNSGYAKGLFVDGLLTGTGPITVQDSGLETVNPWDSSTTYFTSSGTAAQNTYSGTITVNPFVAQGGSYLFLLGTNALANATISLAGDNSATAGRFGSPTLLFGSGTNLDGVGYATIGGLSGSGSFVLANTLVSQTGSSIGAPFALTVGNNNSSSSYSGVISGAGSLTKVGTGTLTLSGVNTYTGDTFVNGGTLALTAAFVNSTNFAIGTGATLDVSTLGPLSLLGNLASGGTFNGSLITSPDTKFYAGTDGGFGTNTVTGSLTLAAGTILYLDLGTVHNGANDLIMVAGSLTANNNSIHLKAPSTSAILDSSADYVLITSPAGISGSFPGAPTWDVAPANAAHYTIVTGPHSVSLHYTASSAPTAAGFASPSTALRNQNVALSVTTTNGIPATVNSVVVNASPIGGPAALPLVNTSGNLWTASLPVSPDTLAGAKTLIVTVTDTGLLSSTVNIPLTVVVGNDVWDGIGANNNFSTGVNWTNQLAPGFVGDSLEFNGLTRPTPNLDNNYTIASLAFDSGAGAFTFGTANSSTLTLVNGMTNNSALLQTFNVPMAFNTTPTINAAAGSISLSGVLSGTGGFTKMGGGTLTLSGSGNSLSGTLTVLGGTVNVPAGSTAFGTGLSAVGYRDGSGNLTVSGGSLTTAGELWVGGSDLNGTAYNALGALTVSGGANVSLGKLTVARGNNNQNTVSGTVTVTTGSTLSTENDLLLGFAGNNNLGHVIVNGGTLNVGSTTKRWVILSQWDTANAEIDVNSGQMNVNANTDVRFAISGNTGTNTFNLNGGAVTFYSDNATTILGGSGVVDLHQGNGATTVNTFNLNGGTLTVSGITSANTAGTRTFNFNGGTLKAVADNSLFLTLGAGNATAYVRDGGAIIDAGSFSIGVGQPLLHSAIAGDNSADGGLTKFGPGTLSLSGASSYNGQTLISAGSLALIGSGSISGSTNILVGSGAIFDVSGVTFTLAANQALSGFGTVNGSVATTAGSMIYAGSDGTYGTNTFNNDLSLVSGAACYLDIGTVHNGNNDQLIVNGMLTANGNPIHLKGPSTASSLDQAADYVLITTLNPISGSFATTPVWDVAPANAGHYTVVTSGNTVSLHYNAIAAPVVAASAKPTSLLRNQPTVITANVLPGSSAISTVTVDVTPLGGSLVALVQSNSSSLYTNAVTIPATMNAGAVNLTVTATDTSARSGSASVALTIKVSSEVWSGLGGNLNWSTNPNWISGYAPGSAGDALVFAGSAGLTPNMDTSYSASGLSFSNNAASFSISTANSSTLTLTANGILNNSTAGQIVNVPVQLSAPENITANSGNLTLASTLDTQGNPLTVNGTNNTTISGLISGANLAKSGLGALTLSANGNAFSGNLTVIGGSLNVTAGAATFGSTLSYVGYLAGSGNLNISGGTFTTPAEIWVGGSDQNGTAFNALGTLTVSGGANVSLGKLTVGRGNNNQNTVSGIVTVNSGSLSSESDILLGFAGNTNLGKVVLNGGTINVATATKRWIIMSQWDTANSEFDVNGGQLNINANTDIRFAINGNNGTNTFNLNAGAVTFYSDNATTILGGSGVVDLHQGTGSSVVNTFNLNGGTLTVSQVYAASGSGTRTFNFNGGTLKATGNNGTFVGLGTGSAAANVRNGGAIIDDGGFAITIAQPLLHSTIAGDNATDGGLTKFGAGTLTLGSANTYNGNTIVKAGTLELVLATVAPTSTLAVSNGASLKLDFTTTNTVAGLILNGVAQNPGVYNSTTAAPYITGAGSLLVGSPIASNPTNMIVHVAGSSMNISWPADHLGWILQTNAVGVTATGAWFAYPGSVSVTSESIPISPAAKNVYFRLAHP